MDLLDAVVAERGRVPAAEVLGVNYRTLEFRDASAADGHGDVAPEVGDGNAEERDGDVLERRVKALEAANAGLRELADSRAGRLEELERRVAALEGDARQPGSPGRVTALPVGRHGAGVVTLEEQPDEAHAFGPAAPLVTEWRKLRTGGDEVGSRVDWAVARIRRWDLETEMLRNFQLTPPPETDPLDESRRKDHVRRRRGEALAESRRELGRAKRTRLLRRLLTLGVWRTSFV